MCPINQTKITLSITKFVLPKHRAIFFRLYIIAAVHLLGKLKKNIIPTVGKKGCNIFPRLIVLEKLGEPASGGTFAMFFHGLAWLDFHVFFVWSQIMRIIGPNIFRLNNLKIHLQQQPFPAKRRTQNSGCFFSSKRIVGRCQGLLPR
jgi:hypothetical protein